MNLRAFPLISLLALAPGLVSAQKGIVDHRDQADGWYLPVKSVVTINGGTAKDFTVTLFKDNEQVIELPPSKKSAFELDLDLNAYYTIVIRKEGYREKKIFLDTNMPPDQVKYDPYPCFVNLEPADKFTHSDPFYLDFPSALVRWDDDKKAFVHSDSYLADIQLKMALLAAQMETK